MENIGIEQGILFVVNVQGTATNNNDTTREGRLAFNGWVIVLHLFKCNSVLIRISWHTIFFNIRKGGSKYRLYLALCCPAKSWDFDQTTTIKFKNKKYYIRRDQQHFVCFDQKCCSSGEWRLCQFLQNFSLPWCFLLAAKKFKLTNHCFVQPSFVNTARRKKNGKTKRITILIFLDNTKNARH